MPCFRLFLCVIIVTAWTACSGVRVAMSDSEKRIEYTEKSKSAYLRSDAGKLYTLRNSLIDSAHQYLGTPYKYAGTDPAKGFDCSGLVFTVAKQNHLDLPRTSGSMACSAPHIDWKKATTGDLVFFGDHGRIHHVGLVEKNNGKELYVIHSTSQRGVMSENVLVSTYWKKRLLFAVDISSFQKNKAKA